MRNTFLIPSAMLVATAMLVAGCGSDDSGGSGNNNTGGQVGLGGSSGNVGTGGGIATGGTGNGTGGTGNGTGGTGNGTGGSDGTGGGSQAGVDCEAGGGYVCTGSWHGYAWTAGSTTPVATITPANFEGEAAGAPLCVTGSVGRMVLDGSSQAWGVAMLGVNLNQSSDADSPVNPVVPTGTGIAVDVDVNTGTELRVQIQGPNGETDPNDRWCASIPAGGKGEIAFSDFNTECWGTMGTAYAGEPITGVMIVAPGAETMDRTFDFCLNSFEEVGGDVVSSGELTGRSQSVKVTAEGREYVIQNNVWGTQNASQTLTYEGNNFTVTATSGSGNSAGAPLSFPSVFIGSNYDRATSGSNLPIQVSAIQSIPTNWTYSNSGVGGVYNAAYDVWFSTTAAGDPGAPSAGYLMVWLYTPGSGAQPIGSPQGNASIAGANWTIWKGQNGENGLPCVSYVRQGNTNSMTFDLNEFIEHAVDNNHYVQPSWHLTNVFAGFEIWSGGVGLSSTSFSAVVN